jgi:hypothetical protein
MAKCKLPSIQEGMVDVPEDVPRNGERLSGYQKPQGKWINVEVKPMIGNIEDLHEICSTLDVNCKYRQKYITSANSEL